MEAAISSETSVRYQHNTVGNDCSDKVKSHAAEAICGLCTALLYTNTALLYTNTALVYTNTALLYTNTAWCTLTLLGVH